MKQRLNILKRLLKAIRDYLTKKVKMNELTPTAPVKPVTSAAREARELNSLVGFLNNPSITGAAVPAGAVTSAAPPLPSLPTRATPLIDPPRDVDGEPMNPARMRLPTKIFFTGRMKSGKDNLAERIGATVFGFADPIYAVQSFFFCGSKDKTLPGARAFLQLVGQWGRGEISPKYPITPARALFTHTVQQLGAEGKFDHPEVSWATFGQDENIWLEALLSRAAEANAERSVITGVRFPNEFKALVAAGWTHYHVLCSQATWTKRLVKSGLTINSTEVNDLSEKMAAQLDADVMKKMRSGTGMLRAVWCDDEAPCPSKRIHTINSFAQGVAIDEVALPVSLE